MNMETVRQFVALEKEKAEVRKKLAQIEQDLDTLEAQITPEMMTDGIQSLNVDGRTVYLSRDIYVGPADSVERGSVIDALKSADLGDYVKEDFNTRSLQAFVREIAIHTEEECKRQDRMFDESAVIAALPEALRSAVKVAFVHKIKSRKA